MAVIQSRMPRAYPKREWITDYESFRTQLNDEDSRYYFYLMVLLAEKHRKRLANKEKNRRARLKEASPDESVPATTA